MTQLTIYDVPGVGKDPCPPHQLALLTDKARKKLKEKKK